MATTRTIRRFRGKTIVIKYGGHHTTEPALLQVTPGQATTMQRFYTRVAATDGSTVFAGFPPGGALEWVS